MSLYSSIQMQAEATAALLTSIRGFRSPPSDKPLGILPFALDEETCQKMLAGIGSDDWVWDKESQTVRSGHDQVVEVNLYPQGTGSPGNRGTVDNGNNATYTIIDFVGVTVLDVKLTGALSSKRVTIQPTNIVTHSAIASPGNSSLGHFIYSPVWLVR